jgi:hypothetical protein
VHVVVDHADPLDAAGKVGLPVLALSRGLLLGVSSAHQPSFFIRTWSNSGKPVVMSESFECEPSSASRFTPSLETPKLARKQPPPSIIFRSVR